MWLYEVFFIKKKEKKRKRKKRDNTLGRFPPLQICSVFLPALLDPLLSRILISHGETLHSAPPHQPCFFFFQKP